MNDDETKEFEKIIDKIRQNGAIGRSLEEINNTLIPFVRKKVKHYSEVIGLSELAILRAIEGKRDYWSLNYYQEANFPDLKDVLVLESRDDFLKKFPSKQFYCPRCDGISTNPKTCNSGKEMSPGEICDWKSWGLFRTLGMGIRIAVRREFEEFPFVDEIFRPVEMGPIPKKEKVV